MLERMMQRWFGQEPEWRKFVIRWLGVSLALHLIAAFFSVGHHSADEYFQILEFMNHKLGRTPLADLAVEFRELMRPWLQPALYYVFAKGWLALGIDNPFVWAWSFRTFAGLVGWASLVALAAAVPVWLSDPRARRLAVIGLALFWFLPALHVRPSSESLGGSTYLLGLVLGALACARAPGSRGSVALWLAVGALFGASFESRFQMGLMVFGGGAWFLLLGRPGLRNLAALAAGFLAVFALGRAVDAWGYGTWAWSPWNYVHYNLLRGEVNRYGQAPWWDIFRMSFTESWPVLGLLVVLTTIGAWFRYPRHALTWSHLPFFLVHEWIAHKELRFFFPIAMAAPVMLALCLTSPRTGRLWRFPEGFAGRALRGLGVFLLVNNLIALVALCLVPFARTAYFYEKLWNFVPSGASEFVIHTRDRDPYELLGSNVHYYRHPAVRVNRLPGPEALRALGQAGQPFWFFETRFELLPEYGGALKDAGVSCEPVLRTMPDWMRQLNVGGWVERATVWTLFRCEAAGKSPGGAQRG